MVKYTDKRRGRIDVLEQIQEVKYLSQENSNRYRAIMRFFYSKYEEAEYWLYKEEIYDEVKQAIGDYQLEECERDLEFLIENNSLKRLQDTKNINTLNDFKYKNFRYQMTNNAVVIERMTLELEEMEVKVASLEPRLFERINHLIKQLIDIYSCDENKIYELWTDLNADFKNLNEQYQDFLKQFHEAKTEELLQSEAFLAFKSSMINYINNFISSYIKSASSIKNNLLNIDDDKITYLMDSLVSHQRKAPKISSEFNYDKLRKVNLGKWQSLRKWFISDTSLSEGERLLEATQNVIEKMYKYASSLIELHGNMINRKEEYVHICHLFDKMTTMEEANSLSLSVFGVMKAQHYKGISELNTDLLIKSYEVDPIQIPISTNNRDYKIKTTVAPIIDKSAEKRALLREKQIEEESRKAKIKALIRTGQINLTGDVKLDILERRYILGLIEKYNSKAKETEFGYAYTITDVNKEEKCHIISPDGIFELNSRLINIEVGGLNEQ